MTTPHPWDSLPAQHFLDQGSLKWTTHEGALPAFVAEMDFPLAEEIIRALQRNLDAQRLGYLPEYLAEQLTHTTAEFLESNFHWSVSPRRIYPVADVLVAYDVVLDQILEPGTPVILPTPAYMPFLSLTPLRGHPVIEVPFVMEGDRPTLDYERIGRELRAGAGAVILCNPHNPLGLVHTRDELEELARVVNDNGGLVFADEIHAPLVFDGEHIPYASLGEHTAQHTVTAVSASKAWNLAGMKCAQLIVTADHHREILHPKKFLISHGVSTPGVEATIAAYRDGGRWLGGAKSYIAKNIEVAFDHLSSHLGEAVFRRPQGTYIGWLDLRQVDPAPHESVAEMLLANQKIALTDGARCGEVGRGHVRMILATPTPILTEILTRLTDEVAGH